MTVIVDESKLVPALGRGVRLPVEVVAFGMLVLVMVLRPQGLLAKRGALAAAG